MPTFTAILSLTFSLSIPAFLSYLFMPHLYLLHCPLGMILGSQQFRPLGILDLPFSVFFTMQTTCEEGLC